MEINFFRKNTGCLVQSFRKLVDCWGDFESGQQNLSMSLDSDVSGPSNHSSQIESLSNSVRSVKASLLGFEQRVLSNLLGIIGLSLSWSLSGLSFLGILCSFRGLIIN